MFLLSSMEKPKKLTKIIITTNGENPSSNKTQMPTPPSPSPPSSPFFSSSSSSSPSDELGFFYSQPMLMIEQNEGLPISPNGGFYNGVSPNLQIVDGSGENPFTLPSHGWDLFIKRSPRSKRRMGARKIISPSFSPFPSFSCFPYTSWKQQSCPATTCNYYKTDDGNMITPDGKKLKCILEKELKNSDVGALGRIILPKKPSEENLPRLSVKEGIQIKVRDVCSREIWSMRYRYWPNNNSRMYVLENTGDFVRRHELKNGDLIMIYQDENDQFYIFCKKVQDPSIPVQDEHRCRTTMSMDGLLEKMPKVGYSSSNVDTNEGVQMSNARNGAIYIPQLAMEVDAFSDNVPKLAGYTSSHKDTNEGKWMNNVRNGGISVNMPTAAGYSSSNMGVNEGTRMNNVRNGGISITQPAMAVDACSDTMVMEGVGGIGFEYSISSGIEDCDFSDLERLPGFEDYDFSLFYNPMNDFMDVNDEHDGRCEANAVAHH